MKKYIRYADFITLLLGVGGLLLRLVHMLGGTDGRGLYPSDHPAWIGLWVLTALVAVGLFLLTRQAEPAAEYQRNYTASIPGAIGCALAALGVANAALGSVGKEPLDLICTLLGIGAAVGLAQAALARVQGKKPWDKGFFLLCAFWAGRAFLLGRQMGSEPELCRYLPQMLLCLAMIPACYQMWGFVADMGDRKKSLFWGLLAMYLCLVGIYGQDWLLHLTSAIWLMTNLCAMQVIPAPATPIVEEAEVETAAPMADPLENLDADAMVAEILQKIERPTEE